MQRQIADSAYRFQLAVEGGRVIVGVNRFHVDSEEDLEIRPRVTPEHEEDQRRVVQKVRAERTTAPRSGVASPSSGRRQGSDDEASSTRPKRANSASYATIGEIFGRLREVWGRYRPRAEV